jgi:hypothetical protein
MELSTTREATTIIIIIIIIVMKADRYDNNYAMGRYAL